MKINNRRERLSQGDFIKVKILYTELSANNSTRVRLGCTLSYICCFFVHPNLDSAPLFVGIRTYGKGLLKTKILI